LVHGNGEVRCGRWLVQAPRDPDEAGLGRWEVYADGKLFACPTTSGLRDLFELVSKIPPEDRDQTAVDSLKAFEHFLALEAVGASA
jgi:hypothetical protein